MKKFQVYYSCEMGLVAEISAKDANDARAIAQTMLENGVWRGSHQLEMVIDSEDVEILE